MDESLDAIAQGHHLSVERAAEIRHFFSKSAESPSPDRQGGMKDASENHSSAGPTRTREPLPRDVVDLTAQRLRVLAEPNRIALLDALNAGEAGVQELADVVGLPHQDASHHLAVLHQAGVLVRRRRGRMTLYAVTDWSAWWLIEQIARWVESCQDEQGASAPTE